MPGSRLGDGVVLPSMVVQRSAVENRSKSAREFLAISREVVRPKLVDRHHDHEGELAGRRSGCRITGGERQYQRE